jgi:hypothetical protein
LAWTQPWVSCESYRGLGVYGDCKCLVS